MKKETRNEKKKGTKKYTLSDLLGYQGEPIRSREEHNA